MTSELWTTPSFAPEEAAFSQYQWSRESHHHSKSFQHLAQHFRSHIKRLADLLRELKHSLYDYAEYTESRTNGSGGNGSHARPKPSYSYGPSKSHSFHHHQQQQQQQQQQQPQQHNHSLHHSHHHSHQHQHQHQHKPYSHHHQHPKPSSSSKKTIISIHSRQPSDFKLDTPAVVNVSTPDLKPAKLSTGNLLTLEEERNRKEPTLRRASSQGNNDFNSDILNSLTVAENRESRKSDPDHADNNHMNDSAHHSGLWNSIFHSQPTHKNKTNLNNEEESKANGNSHQNHNISYQESKEMGDLLSKVRVMACINFLRNCLDELECYMESHSRHGTFYVWDTMTSASNITEAGDNYGEEDVVTKNVMKPDYRPFLIPGGSPSLTSWQDTYREAHNEGPKDPTNLSPLVLSRNEHMENTDPKKDRYNNVPPLVLPVATRYNKEAKAKSRKGTNEEVSMLFSPAQYNYQYGYPSYQTPRSHLKHTLYSLRRQSQMLFSQVSVRDYDAQHPMPTTTLTNTKKSEITTVTVKKNIEKDEKNQKNKLEANSDNNGVNRDEQRESMIAYFENIQKPWHESNTNDGETVGIVPNPHWLLLPNLKRVNEMDEIFQATLAHHCQMYQLDEPVTAVKELRQYIYKHIIGIYSNLEHPFGKILHQIYNYMKMVVSIMKEESEENIADNNETEEITQINHSIGAQTSFVVSNRENAWGLDINEILRKIVTFLKTYLQAQHTYVMRAYPSISNTRARDIVGIAISDVVISCIHEELISLYNMVLEWNDEKFETDLVKLQKEKDMTTETSVIDNMTFFGINKDFQDPCRLYHSPVDGSHDVFADEMEVHHTMGPFSNNEKNNDENKNNSDAQGKGGNNMTLLNNIQLNNCYFDKDADEKYKEKESEENNNVSTDGKKEEEKEELNNWQNKAYVYNNKSPAYQQMVDMFDEMVEIKVLSDKFELLIRILHLIPQCLHNLHNTFITSDDLIAILSYCLAHTKSNHITANFRLLADFIDDRSLLGERGFAITTFQCCYAYLRSLCKTQLTKTQRERQRKQRELKAKIRRQHRRKLLARQLNKPTGRTHGLSIKGPYLSPLHKTASTGHDNAMIKVATGAVHSNSFVSHLKDPCIPNSPRSHSISMEKQVDWNIHRSQTYQSPQPFLSSTASDLGSHYNNSGKFCDCACHQSNKNKPHDRTIPFFELPINAQSTSLIHMEPNIERSVSKSIHTDELEEMIANGPSGENIDKNRLNRALMEEKEEQRVEGDAEIEAEEKEEAELAQMLSEDDVTWNVSNWCSLVTPMPQSYHLYARIIQRLETELIQYSDPSRIKQDGWQFVHQKKQTAVYRRQNGVETVACVKGIGIIDEPVHVIARFINDHSQRWNYDTSLSGTNVIECLQGGAIQVIHLQFKASKWIINSSKRDFCILRAYKILGDGTHVIMAQSIGHAGCPEDPNYIRSHLYVGGWVIRPLADNSNQSDVTYVYHCDMGGSIPNYVKGMLSEGHALVIDGVRRCLQKLRKGAMKK